MVGKLLWASDITDVCKLANSIFGLTDSKVTMEQLHDLSPDVAKVCDAFANQRESVEKVLQVRAHYACAMLSELKVLMLSSGATSEAGDKQKTFQLVASELVKNVATLQQFCLEGASALDCNIGDAKDS